VSPFSVATRVLGSRARNGSRAALYLTVATTGFRIVRRVMSTRQKTLLRFEVKPGEVYEIRGVRRGR
jgi:hypothetical protein